jgi:phosphate transport system substrate-binding protein
MSYLALLDKSDIKQKDPEYLADLKSSERKRFEALEYKSAIPIKELRNALSDSKYLKFLKIDGVVLSNESLTSRRYPLTAEVYAVIRAYPPPGNPALVLRNWLLSQEGKSAIAASGYIPSP